jgi:hypothetical protein
MLADFVHSDAALLRRVMAQFESGVDLLAKHALESVGQRFTQF